MQKRKKVIGINVFITAVLFYNTLMRSLVVPVIALLVFFTAGCSPFITSYKTAPSADFAPLATYRWENETAAAAPVTAHITRAVEAQLALRGYAKTAGGQPGFLAAYQLVVADVPTVYRIDMGPRSDVPAELYYRKSYLAREWLTEYMYIGTIRKVGVLTIVALHPRTKLVLWQGVAEGVFDEYASPVENQKKECDAAVELMQNFPLRKK